MSIESFPTNIGEYKKLVAANKPVYTNECIGEFSLDNNGNLELGRAELKHVYEELVGKKHNIDMLQGMNKQVEKRRVEDLNKIFHWLMATAAPNSSLKEALNGCEFVSRRGPLSRIASAPYDADGLHDVGQKLACAKYKGIYFLREFGDTDGERKLDEYQEKMVFLGRKFEQLITTSDPRQMPDRNAVVDPNAEFNGVFKAKLKIGSSEALNILCAAEVDAISQDGKFVELKTQLRQMGWGKNFANKAIKWYLQSYVVGIKKMVVGCHNNFHLTKVENFPLDSLLPLCGREFRPEVCMAFLDAFLRKIKLELDKLPEGVILVAERAPHGRIYEFTVEKRGDKDLEVISEEFKAHGWTE